jgi:signal transduction histidine kinase
MTTEGETGSVGRVLVVDDTPANVRLLAGILKIEGFEVETAQSGPEALALLGDPLCDVCPDVVLLDVMMPEMDGFEVCARVKESRPFLPVVMVTALQEAADRVRALEAGADDFLTKPVDEVEVVARVRSLVRVKRQHDDLERANEELRRAEALRDSLTAMLVHDLRTPLTAIIGPLEMLVEGTPASDPPTPDQELLSIAHQSAHRLLHLVNDILDVGKMESGQMTLERAEVPPARLLTEALQQVTPLAAQKRIDLRQEVEDGATGTVYADEDLLRRVLVNLLGNAVKFTPSGGSVSVVAQPDADGGHAWRFSVRDTGEGIPEEAFDRIFEKFGQAPGQMAANRRVSTGLGLTFCKMAVEAHGGSIGVESEIGQGSTFWFTVPPAG